MAKHRTPLIRFDIPPAVAERAATRYEKDEFGCYLSTYSRASHGYAQIGWTVNATRPDGTVVRVTMTTAHRAAWVHYTGEQIPEGMTVDHTCRRRPCVKREHLRLLSNMDNASDNNKRPRMQPVYLFGNTCRKGHDLYLYVSGATGCRECQAARMRRKRAKQRDAA